MRYLATLRETEHEFEFEELGSNACAVRMGEERFELDLRRVGPAFVFGADRQSLIRLRRDA